MSEKGILKTLLNQHNLIGAIAECAKLRAFPEICIFPSRLYTLSKGKFHNEKDGSNRNILFEGLYTIYSQV